MKRYRPALIVAAALLAELVVLKLLPAAGSGQRGAPNPILFLGLIHGLVASLTAAGIVLIYRSIRVINFAQMAIGTAGFVLAYNFIVLTPVPFPIAVLLGVALAAAVGMIFEIALVRRFFHAPRLVLTVFTIVAAAFVGGTARTMVDALPIFPERAERTVREISGAVDLPSLLPFSSFSFTVPGSPIEFGFIHLFAICATLLSLFAVAYFLRSTRAGVAVRALAENSERASLLGISVGLISAIVWGISGALSGVGATLSGFLGSPAAALAASPEQLLAPLAAAVLARMKSIPVAVAASVGIELFSRSIEFLQPDFATIPDGILLLIIVFGLLSQRAHDERSEKGSGSWEATDEVRPVPRELSRITGIRVARWALGIVLLAGIIVFPFVSSTGQTYLGSLIAVQAIVMLSLVVLTGWTGQVSLGQLALAAVGAIVAGKLAADIGLPWFIAIPIGTIVTAAVAVGIGLPALRLPGLFLAVATFAFAAGVRSVLFNERLFGWLLPDGGVTRPSLPFVNFEDERSMYFLSVVALGACVVAVRNLRASRFGRILIGLRENEPNAQSAGVPPLRMKLYAFGIAGALAGFGGTLLAFQQRGVTADSFTAQGSVDFFVISMLGGIGNVFGPLMGAAVINGLRQGSARSPRSPPRSHR